MLQQNILAAAQACQMTPSPGASDDDNDDERLRPRMIGWAGGRKPNIPSLSRKYSAHPAVAFA